MSAESLSYNSLTSSQCNVQKMGMHQSACKILSRFWPLNSELTATCPQLRLGAYQLVAKVEFDHNNVAANLLCDVVRQRASHMLEGKQVITAGFCRYTCMPIKAKTAVKH